VRKFAADSPLLFCYRVAIINNIRGGGLTFVPFGDTVISALKNKLLVSYLFFDVRESGTSSTAGRCRDFH